MQPRYGSRFDCRQPVVASIHAFGHAAGERCGPQRLAKRGRDPVYGSRPLKRAIQRLLQDSLAMMLLEGKFAEGDTIEVDVKDGELSFTKAKVVASVA